MHDVLRSSYGTSARQMVSISMWRSSFEQIAPALEFGYGFRTKSVGLKRHRYHLLIRLCFSTVIPFCEFIFLPRLNRRGTKWRSSLGLVSTNGRLQ